MPAQDRAQPAVGQCSFGERECWSCLIARLPAHLRADAADAIGKMAAAHGAEADIDIETAYDLVEQNDLFGSGHLQYPPIRPEVGIAVQALMAYGQGSCPAHVVM